MGRRKILSINILIIIFAVFEFGKASHFSNKKIKRDEKTSFNNITLKKNRHLKRKISLDDERPKNESFVPVNIYFDLLGFNTTVSEYQLEDYKDIFYDAMNKAKNLLKENLLINIDLNGDVEFDETDYAEDWEIEYFNNEVFQKIYCKNFNYYIIFVFDEENSKIISSKILDVFGDAPFVGKIIINPTLIKPYLSKEDRLNYLTTYMLHHFIHLLGFHIDISGEFVFGGIIKEQKIEGLTNYYVDSENIINYAKKYFDCSSITRISLELDQDDGNIHWPSRILLGDIMTSFDYPEEQILSGFTLAFLEDLPYIHVVYNYTGGLMRFGKNKGCYFINKGCTEDFPDKEFTFGNEFYLPSSSEDLPTYEPSCSSGRLSKTFHMYSVSGTQIMGPEKTEFCPISEYNRPYLDDSRYISMGLCSNENLVDTELQESFTSNSFCVLSSLVPDGGILTSTIRAVCHEMYCTSGSLTIKIGEYFIVCPRSGGRIEVENFQGYLLCPDYNLICTGTRICNNIYDCIKEQSEEINETFYYNYTIKTTQNSEVYSDEKVIYGYELTQEGNCTYLCGQCDKNKICYKCAPHYKPDENDNTKCIEKDPKCKIFKDDDTDECKLCNAEYFLAIEDNNNFVCQENGIKNQYYITQDDEDPSFIYYKRCHNGVENCYLCESNTKCTECINNEYKLVDEGSICGLLSSQSFCLDTTSQKYKSCSYFMENCNKCQLNNGDFECLQCGTGFALFHDPNEAIQCTQITSKDVTKYYTTDEGKNYYPCNNAIPNCDTCESQEKCLTCIDSYILVNGDSLCLSNDDINNGKYYIDPDRNNYYFLCSESLANCDTCDNKYKCNACKSNYVITESDVCIPYSDVVLQLYYLDTDIGKYISCSKISNCEKCSSKTECINCITNYATIGDDLSKCENLLTKKYYFETSLNKYQPCSYKLENCDTCHIDSNNIFYCENCITNYALKHDNINSIVCSEKSYFEGNNNYFTNDTGINYYSCGNPLYHDVANCLECSTKNTCSQCQTGYKLVNQNTKCYLQTDIDNNYIYFNPITQIYSPCSDLISLCKKCNSTENCNECGEEGALEESNICIEKELVENNSYFEDETTHKYVSCSVIDNCITCTSRMVCSTCKEGFDVKDNICQILSPDDDNDNKLSTGAIIGIVFGCVGFLLIVAGVVYFLLSRYKHDNTNQTIIEEKHGNIEDNAGKVEENINLDKKEEEAPKTSKRSIHNA